MWGLVMANVYQHGNWLGYKNGGQWCILDLHMMEI